MIKKTYSLEILVNSPQLEKIAKHGDEIENLASDYIINTGN